MRIPRPGQTRSDIIIVDCQVVSPHLAGPGWDWRDWREWLCRLFSCRWAQMFRCSIGRGGDRERERERGEDGGRWAQLRQRRKICVSVIPSQLSENWDAVTKISRTLNDLTVINCLHAQICQTRRKGAVGIIGGENPASDEVTGHAAEWVGGSMQQAGPAAAGGGGGGGGSETQQNMSSYSWAESTHYSTPVKQMEGETDPSSLLSFSYFHLLLNSNNSKWFQPQQYKQLYRAVYCACFSERKVLEIKNHRICMILNFSYFLQISFIPKNVFIFDKIDNIICSVSRLLECKMKIDPLNLIPSWNNIQRKIHS